MPLGLFLSQILNYSYNKVHYLNHYSPKLPSFDCSQKICFFVDNFFCIMFSYLFLCVPFISYVYNLMLKDHHANMYVKNTDAREEERKIMLPLFLFFMNKTENAKNNFLIWDENNNFFHSSLKIKPRKLIFFVNFTMNNFQDFFGATRN